jgi:tetratricopeptide (TPR) repeat protein
MKIFSNRKIVIAILIASVFLIYSNSLFNEFVWDDTYILQKEEFADWKNAGLLFLKAHTIFDVQYQQSYYRPLADLTLLIDYQLWKLNPFWYHLENVLFHAIATCLFYMVIFNVFRDNSFAFLSSFIFAVHPAATESVNLIAARNVILCAIFSLGSILVLIQSRGGKLKWAVFSVILYSLSLLSREQSITLPVFLLSITLLSRSKDLKVNGLLLISFFAVTAVYFIVRYRVLGVVTSQEGIELSYEKIGMVLSCSFEYFRIMLFPLNLNIEYIILPLKLISFKSLTAITGMIILIYLSIKRDISEQLRLSFLWLLVSFIPISNIISIPSAPVADRYIYIPLLGMCLAAGYFIRYLHSKKQVLAATVFIILVVGMGALTHARNNVWKNGETLWKDVVKKIPAKSTGYYNLGVIYQDKGFTERAIEQYLVALEKDPADVYAHINLGIIYHSQGHVDKAVRKFRDAIKAGPGLAKGYYNLARAYHSIGQFDKAIEQYRIAIIRQPDYAEAYNNMGSAWMAKGKIDDAITYYRAAIKFDPKSSNAHNNLGNAYQSKGMIDQAVAEYRIALKLDPRHEKAIANLRVANMIKGYLKKEKKPPTMED